MIEQALRLATWNIHMGIGRDGVRDLRRTAGVISRMKVDLIGLQEVDNHSRVAGDDLDLLGSLTGFTVIPGPTMLKETGDYGNALLTKLPLLDVRRYDISYRDYEPRGLLLADLDWQGERVRAAVTHLGLRPAERRYQVKKVIGHLSGLETTPLFLMGDFNEWLLWGRPLRWLQRHFGRLRSPATFPARWPLLCLDQILAEPRQRLHSKQVCRDSQAALASDHLPLLACFAHRAKPSG